MITLLKHKDTAASVRTKFNPEMFMIKLTSFCLMASYVFADQENLRRLALAKEHGSSNSNLFSLIGSLQRFLGYGVEPTASSICFCTTVPCPTVGYNFLDIGGRYMVSRYEENANGNPLVIEASYMLTSETFGSGGDTTTCTRAYARNYDDDGTKV
jgi:hypothetical protein